MWVGLILALLPARFGGESRRGGFISGRAAASGINTDIKWLDAPQDRLVIMPAKRKSSFGLSGPGGGRSRVQDLPAAGHDGIIDLTMPDGGFPPMMQHQPMMVPPPGPYHQPPPPAMMHGQPNPYMQPVSYGPPAVPLVPGPAPVAKAAPASQTQPDVDLTGDDDEPEEVYGDIFLGQVRRVGPSGSHFPHAVLGSRIALRVGLFRSTRTSLGSSTTPVRARTMSESRELLSNSKCSCHRRRLSARTGHSSAGTA